MNGSVHFTADKMEPVDNESRASNSETNNDTNENDLIKSDRMKTEIINADNMKSDTSMSDTMLSDTMMSDSIMSDTSFSSYTHATTSRPESPTSCSNHGSEDLRMTETESIENAQSEIDEDNKEELHKLIGLKPDAQSNPKPPPTKHPLPLITSQKLKREVNYNDVLEDLPETPDIIDIRLKQEIRSDTENMMREEELGNDEFYRDQYAISLEMQEENERLDRGLARELQELAEKEKAQREKRLQEEQIQNDFGLKKIRLPGLPAKLNTEVGRKYYNY